MKPDFTNIRRIPDEEISSKDIRYLALVEVDLMALYRRWGRPDVGVDSLAEWLSFGFALPSGEKFTLRREAYHPPTPGFLLSVTGPLFFAEAAGQVVQALDIPEARAIELSSEVVSQTHP
ncbi:hypothetical protein [Streptomyces sp. BPSDS2]|uniref:hypothetical protein n=1 Tax=Streptomyces sp. BPSDS2 TaxID=2571021 RepID=UPI0010C1E628|nr:hypothetical protein [Streptomyces sp. BPSDS2]